MDMKKDDEQLDAFDEAMQDETNKPSDDWMDDEDSAGGEGTKASPDVAVVISAPEDKKAESPAEEAGMAPPEAEAGAPAEDAPPAVPDVQTPAEASTEDDRSYQDAVLSISEDFGEDFMSKLEAVIAHHVGKALMGSAPGGDVNARIDNLIVDIQDSFRSMHGDTLRAIQDDVDDMADSPEFKAYVDGLPDAEKAAATATIESGRLPAIIKLLKAFKKSQEAGEPDAFDEEIPDDLDGVKSSSAVPANIAGDNPDDFDDEGWNEDVTRRARR